MIKSRNKMSTPQKNDKIIVTADITPKIKARLKAICAVKGLKIQAVLGDFIREFVEKNEKVLQE